MTASITPWTASGMKESNAAHEQPMRDFLRGLVAQPQDHARFMNMLSMLEHMGSRKIMVSQMNKPEEMDQDTLQHLAEEARHAYFFKRHAERVAGKPLKGWVDDNTMCRIPAAMYFGRMDAGITKKLKQDMSSPRKRGSCQAEEDPRLHGESKETAKDDPYPWVSLIIELRACWLYHIYNDVIEEAGIHLPLKSLIAEEDHHLAEMFEMCGENYDRLKELSTYETNLFRSFFYKLIAAQEYQQAA